MNLRKFTARTIAIASCAAMLSTNVLAATRTISTSATTDGKLQVTLGGEDAGQVTFLAVDADTDLASVTGDDIQYIEQDTKTAGDSVSFTFGQRTDGADKVDLYSGGIDLENVEGFAAMKGVAVKATAVAKVVLDAEYVEYTATTENDFATKTADEVKDFLKQKIYVSYTAVGETEARDFTFGGATTDNSADFEFGTPTTKDNETYTVAVTYKGIDAGSIKVKEIDPKKATSISVSGGTGKTFYYNETETEFTSEKAKALLKDDITVTATYDDTSTGTISGNDVTYVVVGGNVTIQYSGLSASGTIAVNLVKKAITGAEVVNSIDSIVMTAKKADEVTAEDVETKVKAIGGNFVKYTWNDGGTSYDALDELTVSAVKDTMTAGDTWTVTVTSNRFATFSTTLTVNIEERSALGIKGRVTVADTFGITNGTTFKNAVPVGAVVTAIPVATTNNTITGNVGNTSFGYTSYAAMVDANGDYELELPADTTYNIYVSHTRYVVKRINANKTTLSVYRTVLDGNANTMIEIADSDSDLRTNDVTLRYAYAGDMDLDGTLNNTDFGLFKSNFGSSVPDVQ